MRVLAIGEGMVEFRQGPEQRAETWLRGHGGDVVNTAIHLARFGIETCLASALGQDQFSDYLYDQWTAEGLDLQSVARSDRAECGLYFITNDEQGERSFSYRRRGSAASSMIDLIGIDALINALAGVELVYFSLITLAILPASQREQLIAILRQARHAGVQVAFDNNYRPVLWRDVDEARTWHYQALQVSTIGLPTLQDEVELGTARDARGAADLWGSSGVEEIVIKVGKDGVVIDGALIAPTVRVDVPLDTSGAGDAFNAGYLAARMQGQLSRPAAYVGGDLAAWVIQRRGAIPTIEAQIYKR